MHKQIHEVHGEAPVNVVDDCPAPINFQNHRAWRLIKSVYAETPEPSIEPESNAQSVIELATIFYMEKKFAGNEIAQALAKSNIEMHGTSRTIDKYGRFSNFRLEDEGRNAQLKCWEIFPRAKAWSDHPAASMHQSGYGLKLKSLGFMEYDPDGHKGLVRLATLKGRQRLSEREQNKLNACTAISLTNANYALSTWEKAMLKQAIDGLQELFAC